MSISKEVTVSELVRYISDDLLASRADRIERGDPAIFEVNELTLELTCVITDSVGGRAGFDLKVVKAEGDGKHSKNTTQKVTLKLKALNWESTTVSDKSDELELLPLRPRLLKEKGT